MGRERTLNDTKIGGETLDYLCEYNYLRTIFTKHGKINQEVENRIKEVSNVYCQISDTIVGWEETNVKTKI